MTKNMEDFADRTVPLFWCDVETTGLNPWVNDLGDEQRDARMALGLESEGEHLLELSWRVTDMLGNDLDRGASTKTAVLTYTPEQAALLRDQAFPVVRDMHDRTGLWTRLSGPTAMTCGALDELLLADLRRHRDQRGTICLAGNSVRLDLNFVERWLPKTSAFLHHRFVDVTGLTRSLAFAGLLPGRCPTGPEGLEHDSRFDVDNAIWEYRWALGELGAGAA